LARDEQVRSAAGAAARAFIEREHSLSVMVEGYRRVIRDAFGIALPELTEMQLDEHEPVVSSPAIVTRSYTAIDARIANALAALRLSGHDATIDAAADAVVRLRLDKLTVDEKGCTSDEPVTADS
jgi:hypothetical protein